MVSLKRRKAVLTLVLQWLEEEPDDTDREGDVPEGVGEIVVEDLEDWEDSSPELSEDADDYNATEGAAPFDPTDYGHDIPRDPAVVALEHHEDACYYLRRLLNRPIYKSAEVLEFLNDEGQWVTAVPL